MKYVDDIYGAVRLDEPVLVDLLQSPAIQRLHGVLQHGISGLIGITSPITRYEHSVGAMLLVRRLGASLEEQIAALLHDVSHTAFSHVIDYVFDGHESQSFHDAVKVSYLDATEIPALLKGHGYRWQAFLDESAYPLLEQPAPALCADRLDYFMRDVLALGVGDAGEVARALDQLVVADGRIAVADADTARWLARAYIACDDASWANIHEVGIYELTARAIRRALEIGHLTEPDIWGTDAAAWARLTASEDARIQHLLAHVNPATRFTRDDERPLFWVRTKVRTIDPDVVVNGRLLPLSRLDPDFDAFRRAYLARKAGKWPLRIVAEGD